MPIKAVTLDAYGTLVRNEDLRSIPRRIVADHQLAVDPDDVLRHWVDPLPRGRPGLSVPDAAADPGRQPRARAAAARHRRRPAPYVDLYFDVTTRVELYPEVPAALAALGALPSAIVSNADHEHVASWRFELPVRFVLISEAVGAYKPGGPIFRAALERLGLRPDEVLHVGDSDVDDVQGAKAAGLRAAWVNRDGRARRPGVPGAGLRDPRPQRAGRPPVARAPGARALPRAAGRRRTALGGRRYAVRNAALNRRMLPKPRPARRRPAASSSRRPAASRAGRDGRGHGERRGARMPREQPAQMPRASSPARRRDRPPTSPRREIRARSAGGRARPSPRHRARPACPAPPRAGSAGRAEARALGGGRGGKEHHVGGPGGLHRTGGPTVDARGQDAGVEAAVEPRVARKARAIARPGVEREGSGRCGRHHGRG